MPTGIVEATRLDGYRNPHLAPGQHPLRRRDPREDPILLNALAGVRAGACGGGHQRPCLPRTDLRASTHACGGAAKHPGSGHRLAIALRPVRHSAPLDRWSTTNGSVMTSFDAKQTASWRPTLRRLRRPNRGTVACVVDEHPRFHLDALRWFASATRIAGIDPVDLAVSVIGESQGDVLRYLQSQGVRVNSVEGFDSRCPPCNKIAAARRLADQVGSHPVVLTDTDIILLEDPRRMRLGRNTVASKAVDAPNPPLDVLDGVFRAAGLPLPPLIHLDFGTNELSRAGNGNGGLYVMAGRTLRRFSVAWELWATWLLDRLELLGDFSAFVDQVAAALALSSEAIRWQRLPPVWNTPIHVQEWITPEGDDPAVIHYHGRVEPTGLLSLTGASRMDRRIKMANDAIAEVFHAAFPNTTFWNWRYLTNPELGSGVGSRGDALHDKREMITNIVAATTPRSVLDVGCGDGEATDGLTLPGYCGLDVSARAIELYRARRPDAKLIVGDLATSPLEADLVMCLDVLIHIAEPEAYQTLVRLLLASATGHLLIAGYESAPASDSPMIHFHQPLSATIRCLAPTADLARVRDVHGITTWLVKQR